jgi:hypothetical protein
VAKQNLGFDHLRFWLICAIGFAVIRKSAHKVNERVD